MAHQITQTQKHPGRQGELGLELPVYPLELRHYKIHHYKERQKERDQEIEAAIAEETRKLAQDTEAEETMEAEHAEAEAEAKAASDITNIEGVGPKTAEQLQLAGYDTIEKIAAMTDEDILAVPSIGEKTAQKILLSARALLNKT